METGTDEAGVEFWRLWRNEESLAFVFRVSLSAQLLPLD